MAQKFDKLFRKMSPQARRHVEQRANAEYRDLALAELRAARDLTQAQLAKKLGIDQGAVSKIERRTDMYLSTLASYVTRHALAVAGPIREFYPVGRQQTADAAAWRTEIGWPIFETGGEAR